MNTLDAMNFEWPDWVIQQRTQTPAGVTPAADGSDLEGVAAVLSRTEFALLTVMAQTPTRWVSAQELIQSALGTHHRSETSLVRVHVHNMRKKLGPLSVIIESRRGRGYRYMPRAEHVSLSRSDSSVSASPTEELAAMAPPDKPYIVAGGSADGVQRGRADWRS